MTATYVEVSGSVTVPVLNAKDARYIMNSFEISSLRTPTPKASGTSSPLEKTQKAELCLLD